MHILIVALHRATKPTGVCRHAANLARCLAEKDEVTKITLVTGVWQQHYFKTAFLLNSEKIETLAIDIHNNSLSRNAWFLFGLPKIAKKLQPDLVHLSFPLPFWRSHILCPVVVTIHDLYPYKIPENFGYYQAFFNRLFLKQSINNSDALVCVSQTTLEDLKYYFPEVISNRQKTKVIYNIVDFDLVEAKPLKVLADKSDLPFILCVGQHRKNKNIDLLIKSYALLRDERKLNDRTRLIIVGSVGPETEKLVQSIEQLALIDSVLILSEINDNELCWLYQNCRLFVIPSSLEGFCLPLVEALYFSCKVVCSDIPIFREIGSSSCTYFDLMGNAIDNMAQSISQSLTAESPLEYDDCDRFKIKEIATQYLNYYSELI
jgi:glycosyltransferase involved in cell wall biosynthesis